MGKYADIKSNFVKEKLRKADWKKDKKYIDDLIFLEKTFTEGVHSLGENLKLHYFMSTYEKEYNRILKELNPEWYNRSMKEKKKEEERDRKWMKKFVKEEEEEKRREKEDWDKAKKILRSRK